LPEIESRDGQKSRMLFLREVKSRNIQKRKSLIV